MARDSQSPDLSGEANLPGDAALPRAAFRALVCDGVFSQALGVLTGGTLLVGCALSLGASPAFIGILSAVPFFGQLAHVPGIILVERMRRRKAICVAVTLLARMMLVPLAMVPMLADRNLALDVLLLCLAVVAPLGAIGGCAWMSWTCDLVPHARLGHVFARRQLWANFAAVLAGLAGAGLVDGWTRFWPGWRMGGYVGVFTLAIGAAMASTWFLTRMPDVAMPPSESGHLGMLFAKPFRDANFRRVMIFLGSWTFAVNLAMPFFTVYLVQDLGCGLTVPIVLTVVGQGANILALPWWGRASDRLSNKRVIAIAAPMFLAAVLCWVIAAEPSPHAMTLPLIFAAEIVLGAASAGLDLASGNIALKTAPRGAGTVYLGTNGLFKSVCGGIAPIAGGYLAQALSGMPGTIVLPWLGHAITGLSVRPLMVVFIAACIGGLLALTRLRRIVEAGEPALPSSRQRSPALTGLKPDRIIAR